jgi:hypothetical protein
MQQGITLALEKKEKAKEAASNFVSRSASEFHIRDSEQEPI